MDMFDKLKSKENKLSVKVILFVGLAVLGGLALATTVSNQLA